MKNANAPTPAPWYHDRPLPARLFWGLIATVHTTVERRLPPLPPVTCVHATENNNLSGAEMLLMGLEMGREMGWELCELAHADDRSPNWRTEVEG